MQYGNMHVLHVSDMRWLRLLGSIQLQIFCAEYGLFYRALLQKTPIILSILLTMATPYVNMQYGNMHVLHVSDMGWLLLRIDEIIGLFCKRTLQKSQYSARETCNLIDATDRSHLISKYAYWNIAIWMYCTFQISEYAIWQYVCIANLKRNIGYWILAENIVSFIGLFCKRDLWFIGEYCLFYRANSEYWIIFFQ